MSGLSFGLGAKRGLAQRSAAPAKPKKPLTVNDLFSADSSDDEEQPQNPKLQQQQQQQQQHMQQQQPEPQQAQASKRTRWDAAAGATFAPPSDPEVRKAVDKLAEFVAKHGRSFEDITKQRNPGESMFKFLFDPTCADYKYYDSKVQELSLGGAGPSAPSPTAATHAAAPQQPPQQFHQPRPMPAQPALPPPPPTYSTMYAPLPAPARFSHPCPPPAIEEPVEKHIAKQALAAGDSVAAMNAFMKLAAKRDKPEDEEKEPDRSQPLLNSTAFERRKVTAVYKDDGSRGHHMQDFIPPEELAKFMSKCGDEAAALAAKSHQERHALKDDNIGHKLLQKMGWREGEGIGGTQKGITAPVAAGGVKQDNLGLGAAPVHEVSQEDDPFEQYRKRMMLGYKHRPNPLGNPRKPYY